MLKIANFDYSNVNNKFNESWQKKQDIRMLNLKNSAP
jgi:hypothetical protein